jgi:integrase/recombinase XerC
MHPRRTHEQETSASSLGEAVERYLTWQKTQGRKHPATDKTMRPLRQSLQRWLAWTDPKTPVKDFSLRNLEDYLTWLRDDHDFGDGKVRPGLGDQSIKTQFSMIRAFVNRLGKWDYSLHPSLFPRGGEFAMETPDVKKEFYDVYTPDELTRLWSAIGEVDRGHRYRNYAIFAVLLGAGIRLGELANLRDEDFRGNELFIRDPKNREPRFVPITGLVQEAILEYKAKRGAVQRGAGEEEPLFWGEEGGGLSEPGITKVVQRLKKYADGGLTKPMVAGIHKFRHTYATYTVIRERQLKGECNIWELSKRMGHKSIAITERYLHYDRNMKVPESWGRFIYIPSGEGSERYGRLGALAPSHA